MNLLFKPGAPMGISSVSNVSETGVDGGIVALDLLNTQAPRRSRLHDTLKRTVDCFGASLLLLFLAPVFLMLTVLIFADDGWPVLFRHHRVGRDGQVFSCLKFRTMYRDSEAVLRDVLARDPALNDDWKLNRKLRYDPRITRVGRWLRSSSIDELPQLLNVLLGDMSLVGPRPVVAEELEKYYAPDGGLTAYLAVRPGLTGLWQVSGRSETGYQKRVRLDVEYVVNASLHMDLVILIRTVRILLSRHGAY